MYGRLTSHRLGLLALAAVLAFALSATAVYGWETSEQPQQEKPGEHAGKNENKGKEESENKGKEEKQGEQPQPGPTGPVGPVVGGTAVPNQVSSPVTSPVTVNNQSQAQTPAPVETEVKAESESLAGPEVAQTETAQTQPPSQPAQGSQPAELASTGFNAGALAGIGALLIGASLLLFRRRRSA